MSRKPRSPVRILIYRTWAITVIETFKNFYVICSEWQERKTETSNVFLLNTTVLTNVKVFQLRVAYHEYN